MKILKQISRYLVLFLILGMCYSTIELFVRGFTFVEMIFVGGIAGVLIGLLNDHPAYYNRRMWQQCFLGTIITLIVEFVSGYILNIVLQRGIWDYSGIPYNFMGQICLKTAIAWFFLMPFAIYADDFIRWKFLGEEKPEGNVFTNYIKLFTFK